LKASFYVKPGLSRLRGRRDVKLILPLATLVGAVTLLFNSWGALSLSYL